MTILMPAKLLLLVLTTAFSASLLADEVILPKAKPIELGVLVKSFMLDKNTIQPSWAMNSDNKALPLLWLTDGVEEVEYNGRISSRRDGLSRVAIEGKIKKELRRTLQEIPWKLQMGSDGPKKFQPEFIEIRPHEDCFGKQADGCDFELLPTLVNSGLKVKTVCETPNYGSEGSRLYLISAKGKSPAYLIYTVTTGSGGTSNWVNLVWDENNIKVAEACTDPAPVAIEMNHRFKRYNMRDFK